MVPKRRPGLRGAGASESSTYTRRRGRGARLDRRRGGLTALFIVIAPWVMRAFGYGGVAVGLARVLFPIVVLLGLTGIVVGILNSYEHFSVPALAPVFWNLAIVAGLALGVPQAHGIDAKLYVYAVSIVVA